MPEPYIQAWEDELPEHPVIAELRAQPGRWAVLPKIGSDESVEIWMACKEHPNVEVYSQGLDGTRPMLKKARWLPDPVLAAITILKGGGYGG